MKMIYSSPSLIRVGVICQEIVVTFERWPLVSGRRKSIGSSSFKNLWPYQRGCGHIREVAFGKREKGIHWQQLQKFMALLESVACVESGHKERDNCTVNSPPETCPEIALMTNPQPTPVCALAIILPRYVTLTKLLRYKKLFESNIENRCTH